MDMILESVRGNWTAVPYYHLYRPHGLPCYVMLHFYNPVTVTISGCAYSAAKGAFVIWGPDRPHGFVAGKTLWYDWMHLSGGVEESLAKYRLTPNTLYQPTNNNEITQIFEALELANYSYGNYKQELIQLKLNELFVNIARNLEKSSVSIRLENNLVDRMKQVRGLIIFHPEAVWTVENIADMVNICPSYLHTLWRAKFGITPNQDVIMIRIESAKQCLLRGKTVNETAELVGYNNVSHFVRQFKKYTNITPNKFKQSGLQCDSAQPKP